MYDQDVTLIKDKAQTALDAFFGLAKRWQLSRTEAMTLLGLSATSTYANWKNGKSGNIPRDTQERISYLLSIDEALQAREISNTAISQWLRYTLLEGTRNSPMDHMLRGNVIDLYQVHQHLLDYAE